MFNLDRAHAQHLTPQLHVLFVNLFALHTYIYKKKETLVTEQQKESEFYSAQQMVSREKERERERERGERK